MRFWQKFASMLTILLCLWGYLYWRINPARHFARTHTPVTRPEITGKEIATETKHFNVLLLGIDARKQEASRTDVIMLANVNLKNKAVHVISIPRDTRVELPGIGYTKINHAHLQGEIEGGKEKATEASLQAVSALLQCEIDYYFKIDFAGFVDFIDTIGGVEIQLQKPVRLTFAKRTLPAGKQLLDGETTLRLVRERYSLPDGDFGRQRLQFLILETVAHKLLERKFLLRLPTLINDFKTNVVDTNFTASDVISLAWMLHGLPSDGIKYTQLPGGGGHAIDPLVKTRLYYWFPDLEQVRGISEQFRSS